jgi:Protein of unknown function (DUF3106)
MKPRNITVLVLGLFLFFSAGDSLAARDDWRNLSPQDKERVRRNIDRWEKLPPQDKDRVREEYDHWRRLPKDQRERIKQRYDEQRRERQND